MNREDYCQTYKIMRDRLNKKMITDAYIENTAIALGIDHWDEGIFREVIAELSLENPYKADISAAVISNKYYLKYKDTISFEKKPYSECKLGLCDGTGLVWATIKFTWYPEETEHIFRCPCAMGNNHNKKISVWGQKPYDRGYRGNKEKIYKEDKVEKQYDIKKLVDVIGERFE